MNLASHVDSTRAVLAHPMVVLQPEPPTPATDLRAVDALGERIAALAARLHAATYELLVLLGEFDAREGWANGFQSCAHWLHWRTGIDLGAAREKVRVARALPALAAVSAQMRRGALSYAKVRALTRVATPANEQTLVDFALAGTAAHVERLVRGWRRADAVEAARVDESRHLQRQLSTWVDADGMVVIRGRLTPEVGAVVQRALEAAADRLFLDAQATEADGPAGHQVGAAQRRADALGLLAETALSAGLDAGTTGDRYQVVVHVDASDRAAGRGEVILEPDAGGTLELDHGPACVSAETSRRLSCDASVVTLAHGEDGEARQVGRRTRTIPPSIRRALVARDATCQFPGCTAHRCDAHHVEHWADGGDTTLDNLVRLCRRHHRAVHEGGFRVRRTSPGEWAFHRPDERRLPRAPEIAATAEWRHELMMADVTSTPVWDGTSVDIAWALDVLHVGPNGAAAGVATPR
ncbi:MAG: DUF222 domain-containing protein [Vicinamibacterales bacterium]